MSHPSDAYDDLKAEYDTLKESHDRLLAALRDMKRYLDACNPLAGPAVVGILTSLIDAAIANATPFTPKGPRG